MLILEEILFREAQTILQNAKNLNKKLNDLVELIVEQVRLGRHIVWTGAGKCSTICLKTVETMNSLGIPSIHLCSFLSAHGDLGIITENSLVISLSKSGNTKEVVDCLNGAVKKKAKVISISCNPDSEAGIVASENGGLDIVLTCNNEACFMDLAPTNSTTLFCAIGDSLAIVASEKLGMTKEKFLENHSGGQLGKKIRNEINN